MGWGREEHKSRNPSRMAVPKPFSSTHFILHLRLGDPANHLHPSTLDPPRTQALRRPVQRSLSPADSAGWQMGSWQRLNPGRKVSCWMGLPKVLSASYLLPYSSPPSWPQDPRTQAGTQAEQRCTLVHGADWAGVASACIPSSALAGAMSTQIPWARTYSYQTRPDAQRARLFQLTKSGFESLAKCGSRQGRPLSLQNPGPVLVPTGGSRGGVGWGRSFQHDTHDDP